MQRIKKLSIVLANKISAGEVVEAPVSVVKELVDNAIDAGATRIKIEIKEGGKKFIEISDNGIGIQAEDIELAFERFSTSKISKEEELWDIKTLGFRGEFLASVGSIAKVTLSSKTKDETVGTEIVFEGGKIVSNRQVGRGEGTTVTIRELFFNTPARRKFLKSNRAEFAHIHEMVRKYVLSHQNISFKLVNDEKEIFNIPSTKKSLDSIIRMLGKNIASNLIPIKTADDSWELTGFISKPIESQKTRRYQFFYVNKRNIKSKLLNMAVEEGYREQLQKGNFPIVVLFLESKKAQEVDANVHPRKLEIRFAKEEEVLSLVSNIIKNTLMDKNGAYERSNASKEDITTFFSGKSSSRSSFTGSRLIDRKRVDVDVNVHQHIKNQEGMRANKTIANTLSDREHASNQIFSFGQPIDRKKLRESKVIGQIFNEYILAESEDLLLIIDSKSAAERIEYELINSSKKGKKQILLSPKEITLTPIQREILTDNIKLIEKMGYNFTINIDRISLEAVPVIYGQIACTEVLVQIIEMLEAKLKPIIEFEKEIAHSIAKKRTVGILTEKQMQEMIKLLSNTKTPFTTPDGKPTIIYLPKKEFKRKFN